MRETHRYDGAMLRRWLSARVRAAAAVMGIALAAGCSAQPTPAYAVTVVGGFWQFCRANPFPWGGTETGGPGHASGLVTLCARWRYENGVTTLAEVRGFFTAASGYLKIPSLQFSVYTGPVVGRQMSVLVPSRAIPVQVKGSQTSSADTGWFAAARLTGHGEGSLSWRLRDPYLGLSLVAGGAHGGMIPAGDAGMPLAFDGKL
jgi:hypothetical protein